jgi:hypothetical protein
MARCIGIGRGRAWGLGFAALWAAAGVPACGSNEPSDSEPTGGAGGGAAAAGGTSAGTGGTPSGGAAGSGGNTPAACESVFEQYPPVPPFSHVAACSAVSYASNPPTGGNHYGTWAAFQNYDFAVPAGFLVHSLEHGAVVFWYNCPEGCADEVARANALIDSLPVDPLCAGTSTQRRAILVPSPDLDARWAASAWGFLVKAECLDEGTLLSFYAEHYGQGPEDFCSAPSTAVTASSCP